MRLVVVMPVGPGEDVADTLDSIAAYADPSHAVVLVDDTGDPGGPAAAAAAALREVHAVPAPAGAAGNRGGLWVKLAAGYRYACARLRFDLLLRMDTDALLLGPGLEDVAAARVAADPGLGMLGGHRTGPDGRPRDFGPAARLLAREAGPLGLADRRRRATLRRLRAAARANGYAPGEHALGGAFIQPARAVRALEARGWLDLSELASSGLSEDHLFGLMTVAAGFRIGDLGGPGGPMALRWRGLPAHPDDLVAGGALITHSVRSWGDLDEAAVRGRFRVARRAGTPRGTARPEASGRDAALR